MVLRYDNFSCLIIFMYVESGAEVAFVQDVVILGSGAFGLEAMEAAHRSNARSITLVTRDRDRQVASPKEALSKKHVQQNFPHSGLHQSAAPCLVHHDLTEMPKLRGLLARLCCASR